jgi:hypothetical protein
VGRVDNGSAWREEAHWTIRVVVETRRGLAGGI